MKTILLDAHGCQVPVAAKVALVETFANFFAEFLDCMAMLCRNGGFRPVVGFEGSFAGGFAVHSVVLFETVGG